MTDTRVKSEGQRESLIKPGPNTNLKELPRDASAGGQGTDLDDAGGSGEAGEDVETLIQSLGLPPQPSAGASFIKRYMWPLIGGGSALLVGVLAFFLLSGGDQDLTPDDIAFRAARDTGSEDALTAYLDAWPDGIHKGRVKELINELAQSDDRRQRLEERRIEDEAWRKASADGSDAAISTYIAVYPDGRYTDDANAVLERGAYRRALRGADFSAVKGFLAKYPDSAFRGDLDDRAWLLALDTGTVDALDTYLSLYPQGSHVVEAAKLRGQIQGRQQAETAAEDDRAWRKAQNENTEPAYQSYLDSQPQGRYRVEAEQARFRLARERRIAEQRADFVRRHQVELIRLGYRFVAANGEEDDPTLQAIKAFTLWSGAAGTPPIGDALLTALREAPAKPLPLSLAPFKDCGECPDMIVLPAGSFQMGSPVGEVGRAPTEGPTTLITLPVPFGLSAAEITRGQWRACVTAGVCNALNLNGVNIEEDSQPMTEVPFTEAEAYTRWLSRETGFRYRLPTEAEWEYGARAGATTAYGFGNSLRASCGYGNMDELAEPPAGAGWIMQPCQDGFSAVAPVRSFKANAFGLYDMHGNAEEWTADCWRPTLTGKPITGEAYDPPGTQSCGVYTVKGGSYLSPAINARSASRRGVDRLIGSPLVGSVGGAPGTQTADGPAGIGVRVVRVLTN